MVACWCSWLKDKEGGQMRLGTSYGLKSGRMLLRLSSCSRTLFVGTPLYWREGFAPGSEFHRSRYSSTTLPRRYQAVSLASNLCAEPRPTIHLNSQTISRRSMASGTSATDN